MSAVVAGFTPGRRRADAIAAAITAALKSHGPALNGPTPVRSVTISVKMRTNAASVRAVVVTVESEHEGVDAPGGERTL